MIFINTRPTSRAQPLTQAMQEKGLTVLDLPLLELEPLDISEREKKYQQDYYHQPDKYQALVVVSPTAARMGLADCPPGFVPKGAVVAVGHATAEILRAVGWQVHCPDEYSNEGMMRMSQLNTLGAGSHMLVWRGRGGRRVLTNFMQDNEVTVEAIAWYQRRCPEHAQTDFIALQQQLELLQKPLRSNQINQAAASTENLANNKAVAKPIVLVSSGEAFTNWRALFSDDSTEAYALSDFCYLTFGKRLTDMVTALNLHCERIEHLDTDEVWRGVERLQRD